MNWSQILILGASVAVFGARTTLAQPQRLPLTKVGPVDARSDALIGNVFGMHALSDGRVLINDAIRSRLLVFDSTLRNVTVVAANEGAPNVYGDVPVALIPYLGDTTLILDARSVGLLVYDPNGKATRVIAAPKPSDIMTIIGYTGVAYIDPQFRLVYRGVRPPPRAVPGGPVAQPIDSAPIIRANFDTRAIDTVGMVHIAVTKSRVTNVLPSPTLPNGRVTRIPIYDPVQSSDAWTVLSDGTIAIVRAADYHIDWIRMDGSTYSTPKMPFDWRKLSDSDKTGLIEEQRTRLEKMYRDRAALPGAAPLAIPQLEFVPISEMADYMPAVKVGSVLADLDGNAWIPPTTSLDAAPGSLVYDVVNTKGEVTRRVQLPVGRTLAGFGRGGILYFTMNDSTGTHLERARIR